MTPLTRRQARMTPLTRRQALGEMLAAVALLATGCGGGSAIDTGSTLTSTWADPHGSGTLSRARGESLIARTELGRRAAGEQVLATLAHLTDAHVLDGASPARVPFLDRLGTPFESTFRPQETLTAQVLAGAVRAIRSLTVDAVIQGGDLIDNDQSNELAVALTALGGGTVRPGSGPRGYFGVQSAADPDPFYYRPDFDAPRHPGVLQAAVRPFGSPGLRRRWYPVLGDHDILVCGEIPPSAQTRELAIGDEALWELPPGIRKPQGASLTESGSPDGPPAPALVAQFLAEAMAAPKVRVPADPARREMDAGEVIARLRRASALRPSAVEAGTVEATVAGRAELSAADSTLDYHLDIGDRLRVIVFDLARRGGGSGGLVRPGQAGWVDRVLAASGRRWVIAVSHQPLVSSQGGEQLLAVLDRYPRVIAALAGHTHRNLIEPRPTAAGGYWLITTASLIDYPQQARALRVIATAGGGVAIQSWMLDHNFPGPLGTISRQLAYLDAQGGRPRGFAGGRLDRNVTLYRARVNG